MLMNFGANPGDFCPPHIVERIIRQKLREGTTLYTRAEGSSMYPTIHPGSVVGIIGLHPDPIRIGEVVAIRQTFSLRLHRVIRRRRRGGKIQIQTRGDFNAYADEWVNEDEVVGRVRWVDNGTGAVNLGRAAPGRHLPSFVRHWSQAAPRLANLAIRGHAWTATRGVLRLPYPIAVRCFVAALHKTPRITFVGIRGSYARGHWVAGYSDIDFIIEHRFSTSDEIANFWATYEKFKRRFPFLGEVWLCRRDTLAGFLKYGAHRPEIATWKTVYQGKNYRRPAPRRPTAFECQLDLAARAQVSCSLLSGLVARWLRNLPFTPRDRMRWKRTAQLITGLGEKLRGSPPVLSSSEHFETFLLDALATLDEAFTDYHREWRELHLIAPSTETPAPRSYQLVHYASDPTIYLILARPLSKITLDELRRDERIGARNGLLNPMLLTVRLQEVFEVNRFSTLERLIGQRGFNDHHALILFRRRLVLMAMLVARASNPHSARPFTSLDWSTDDLKSLSREILDLYSWFSGRETEETKAIRRWIESRNPVPLVRERHQWQRLFQKPLEDLVRTMLRDNSSQKLRRPR
jgi:hypothetical protein